MAFSLRAHRPRRAFLWVALVVAALAATQAAVRLAAGDIAVLCLHGIADPDPRYAPWSLSRARFQDLLARIAASGRQVVGPEALDRLGDGTSGVLLTFDDSRRSDRSIVQPALAARGWPAVFFVPVEGPTRELPAEDLLALAEAGHSLGSHSQTHSRFRRGERETPEEFRDRLRQEAVESRRALAALLPGPVPVELFAYPRGEHPAEARAAVRGAGYRWAFTTEYGYVVPGGDPLRAPRFMLFSETPMEEVDEYLRQPLAGYRRQGGVALMVALASLLALARLWYARLGPLRHA